MAEKETPKEARPTAIKLNPQQSMMLVVVGCFVDSLLGSFLVDGSADDVTKIR